ncbi:nucleotide disphospho-sugar-binding domain-containing protein [Streptomyces sp. NPDC000410]|uniref:nucleotide disphospho-sugar-binding domain-containing protein n=1 Tax=Streptomyces sp. NPDC000410 TaxID=3154254 RepID=UPI00331AFEA9
MRVLVMTSQSVGHVFPPVAIAQALRAAGHEVLFAVPGAGTGDMAVIGGSEPAAHAGFHVFDAAPGHDTDAMFGQILAERAMTFDRFRTDSPEGPPLAAEVFARTSEVAVERTLEVARDWRPDLVIHTELQAAGPLVASKLGVPAVEHVISMDTFRMISSRFGPWMAAAYERHGVTGPPRVTATIDTRPPSLVRHDMGGWPMRALAYTGGGVLPPWLLTRPERPRVAITLGTMEPVFNGVAPLRGVLEAAGEIEEAEFVLALGHADPTPLGAVPDNVRVEGWVPLSALTRTCVAMIHHGGCGTTLAGLAEGLTHLVVPGGADDHYVAESLRARGLGLVSPIEKVDAGLIRTLLTDEGLRAVAGEVRREMEALPTPAEIVPRLEKLAAG